MWRPPPSGSVCSTIREPHDPSPQSARSIGPGFDACRAEGRAALIGYLPTGYPDVATSIEAMVAISGACDIIEVGVPYPTREWTAR